MPRKLPTPSFIAEFPLKTSGADERELNIRLRLATYIYNASLGEALRRLDLMRETKEWQAAQKMPKGAARTAIFRELIARYGFNAGSIQKYAEKCRDSCAIGDHLGSHDTQTTSLRAFNAVLQYSFGRNGKNGKRIKRGRPRFKGYRQLHSVEGKANTVIRFKQDNVPVVIWSDLVMPLLLDAKDKKGWQAQVLACRTKYVRILRREVRGRTRWFCQLVQEGTPPLLRAVKAGNVGLDIGPSTIAAMSDSDAILETFCPSIVQPWREMRRLERAMDRSRRATNPDNYDEKGRVKRGKKGMKKWKRSNRYKLLAAKRRDRERRLAAGRKREHGELANRILGQGTTIRTEKVSYKSFQKNFGRSTKVRAAGMFVDILRYKAESAGGAVIDINTWKTRLSQYDHTTGEFKKKPLSLRIHEFGDGITEAVQRDLYSAFLAQCCDENTLFINQVESTWSAAEPLLRCAMERSKEPASREGFALSHVVKASELVVRRMKDGDSVEVVDVVADEARATKRLDTALQKPRP